MCDIVVIRYIEHSFVVCCPGNENYLEIRIL